MSNHDYINVGSPMAYHHGKPKNRKIKFLLGGFVLVLAIVLFTTFFGTPELTGSSISLFNNNQTEKATVKITAELNIPELSTKTEVNEIVLNAKPNSNLYISNQKISIPESGKSSILLKNYGGKIAFSKDNLIIDGRTEKVFTEGIPISSKSQDSIKVETDEDFKFNSFEISNNFFFKNLEYKASGTINIDDGTSVSLVKDNIRIQGFTGTIKVNEGKMTLDGVVNSISVDGKQKISISS